MKRYVVLIVFGMLLAATSAAEVSAPQTDQAKLQGTWICAYMERNGVPIPEKKYKDGRLVMNGETFTYTDGDRLVSRGTRKLDPTKTPKAVDDTHSAGAFKGKTYLGIYELTDDGFKTCNGSAGQARPTSFVTTAGSGLLLVVYKREKK